MALAVVVYAVAVVVLTWPLAAHVRDHVVAPDYPRLVPPAATADQLHIIWTLTWVAHALATDPRGLFDGNAFHPEPAIIAQSEHMLGNQLIVAPVWLATGNPVLALNLLVLASLLLSALGMHLLVWRWTGSATAAWVAGFAFAFAPWRFSALRLPQLLPVFYLPLMLLSLDRALAGPNMRAALLAGVALALQTLTSYYLGYVAFVTAGGYVLADLVGRGMRRRGRAWTALALACVVVPLGLVLPITVPYLRSQARGGLTWLWSEQMVEALRASGMGSVALRRTWSDVGGGSIVLAICSVLLLVRAWRIDRGQAIRVLALVLIAVSGVALAAGPAGFGSIWSAPYAWLAGVVPGFVNVRDPTRFLIMTGLATSGLAGYAVAAVTRCVPQGWGRAGVAVAGVAAVLAPLLARPALLARPLPVGPDVPPVVRWLAQHGNGGPVVEVPTGWGALPFRRNHASAFAMYASTWHWLPLLNGHTSYPPPAYGLLEGWAAQLPGTTYLERLGAETGLRWIVVHARPSWRRAAWDDRPDLTLRGVFLHDGTHEDRLYEVAPGLRGPAGKRRFDPARTVEGEPVPVWAPLEVALTVRGLADEIPLGGESVLSLSVENRGRQALAATAIGEDDRVALDIAWHAVRRGRVTQRETVLLPMDVAPGQTLTVPVWVQRPPRPGAYRVTVAVVRGGAGDERAASWSRDVAVRPRARPGVSARPRSGPPGGARTPHTAGGRPGAARSAAAAGGS